MGWQTSAGKELQLYCNTSLALAITKKTQKSITTVSYWFGFRNREPKPQRRTLKIRQRHSS